MDIVQGFEIDRASLFPVLTPHGRQWLSLQDLFGQEAPARVDHPQTILNGPIMLLAIALTQAFVDHAGGLTQQEIRRRLLGKAPIGLDTLADIQVDGLGLTGESAFLQIPQAWMDAGGVPPKPIEGLLRPVNADPEGTAKALRLPRHRIRGVCQACAVVGLYLTNTATKAMAQYWSSTTTLGGLAVVHQVMKGGAFDLPATLLANLQPGWGPEAFPWTRGQESLLDAMAAAPADRKRRAAALIPMMRGQRLVPPVGNGTCDVCMRGGLPIHTHFQEIGEKSLFKCLAPEHQARIRHAARDDRFTGSKIFELMYLGRSAFQHPSYVYTRDVKKADPVADEDDAGEPAAASDGAIKPLIHAESLDEATRARPAWVRYADFLEPSLQLTLGNLVGSGAGTGKAPAVAQHLFSIVTESGPNPAVRFVSSEFHSLFHIGATVEMHRQLATLVRQAAEAVDEISDALVTGASNLFKEVDVTRDGFSLKNGTAKGLNPFGTAKRLASLRGGIGALWTEAFDLVMDTAQRLADDEDEELEPEKESDRVRAMLHAKGREVWRAVERNDFDPSADARGLYLQVRATKTFNQELAKTRAAKAAKLQGTPS